MASRKMGMDNRVVQIFVSKVSTTKLRNVEMMYGDKNDVFLLMKFGDKWSARTATVWEGGSDVSWSYSESVDTNMKWTGTVNEIMAGTLDISAMDDNKMTSSKLIGVGQQQIVVPNALLQNASVGASGGASAGVSTVGDMEVIVEVSLFEKIGGKAAGTVIVTLLIKSAETTSTTAAEAAAAVTATAVPVTAAATALAVAPAATVPAVPVVAVAPAAGVMTLRASSATVSAATETSNAQTIPTATSHTIDAPHQVTAIPLAGLSSDTDTTGLTSHMQSESVLKASQTTATLSNKSKSEGKSDSVDNNLSISSKSSCQVPRVEQIPAQHAGSDCSNLTRTPSSSLFPGATSASVQKCHQEGTNIITIFVSKVSTTKLRNVEMMYGDKNDVFLLMKFGDKWSARTATVWEGGSDVSWSYSESVDTNMKWTGTVNEIMAGTLDISAMDDNKMTSSKLIGVGQQQIVVPNALLQNASVGASGGASAGVSTVGDMEVIVEVSLFEKIGGKAAGTVIVTLLIKSAETTSTTAAAVTTKTVTTTATITAPVTAVTTATTTTTTTAAAAAAATTVVLASSQAVGEAMPNIAVQPHSYPTSGVAYSTAAASSSSTSTSSTSAVTTVPTATAGTHINGYTNSDFNKSNTAAAANAVTASQKIEEPFLTGILHLKSIKCYGLKNVEIMGKNDPYVTVNFGSQMFSTSVIEDAGGDAIFDYLDFKFNVSNESMKLENMILNIFDKNGLRNDVLIGKNSISLRNFLFHMNVNTEISIDILDEKGKISGKVTLYLKIIPHVKNEIIEENIGIEGQVPLNYETVVLRIVRIKIFDLNTVITDKVKKSYTKITVGGVHFETFPVPVHSTGSSYTVFDHLNFSFEVTKQMLEGEKVEIRNYDVGVSNDIVSCNKMRSESKTDKDMEKDNKKEKEKEIKNDSMKKDEVEKKNKKNPILLNIEYFNSVLGFDSVIGSGSASIKSACLQNYELLQENGKQKPSTEELEILTNLVTKKGEYVGKAVLYVTRKLLPDIMILDKSKLFLSPEHSLESVEDVKFKKSYPAGVILRIESVTVHDLKNTEIIGKQVSKTRSFIFRIFQNLNSNLSYFYLMHSFVFYFLFDFITFPTFFIV